MCALVSFIYGTDTVLFIGVSAHKLGTDSPVLAFAVQVVRGGSTLVVDVIAVTALQRTVPKDQLGIFAAASRHGHTDHHPGRAG